MALFDHRKEFLARRLTGVVRPLRLVDEPLRLQLGLLRLVDEPLRLQLGLLRLVVGLLRFASGPLRFGIGRLQLVAGLLRLVVRPLRLEFEPLRLVIELLPKVAAAGHWRFEEKASGNGLLIAGRELRVGNSPNLNSGKGFTLDGD